MPGKTRDYAAISLARILKERTDPHGYPMNDETIVQRLAICEDMVEAEDAALSVLPS